MGRYPIRKANRREKLAHRFHKWRITRHHNLARSRGGRDTKQNIVMLNDETHQLLHKMFGNRTIREIISVLERLDRMKHHQHRRAA